MTVSLKFTPSRHNAPKESEKRVVADILQELGLNREVYVFRRNGEVVSELEPLNDGDELEIIKVVSGGKK